MSIDIKKMNEDLKKSGVYKEFEDSASKSGMLNIKKVSEKVDLNDPIFKNVTTEKTKVGKILGEQLGSNLLVNCENPDCKNQRWVKIADIKRGYGRFCGKQCAALCRETLKDEKKALERKKALQEKSSQLETKKETAKVGDEVGNEILVCCESQSCQNTRWVKKADLKRGYGRFCSKSCAKKKN